MHVEKYRQRIEDVVEQTQQMLLACQSAEWDRFSEIEAQRRCKIKALFVSPPIGNEAECVATGIRKVLEMDQEIISICEAEKRSCADQLTQMSKGRQVSHAYKHHQNTAVGWSERLS